MQSDEQKVLSLANNEKELLESLFNDDHLITVQWEALRF